MKTQTKVKLLGMALAAVAALCGRAEAVGQGTPSYLNIDVTVTSNLSVSVTNAKVSSMSAGTWNGVAGAFILAPGTSTITNDSGYISERWALSAPANAFDSGTGNPSWVIGAVSGNDQVVVQATLGAAGSPNTSCTANEGSWSSNGAGGIAPTLSNATLTEYTSVVLSDTQMGTPAPDIVSSNRMNAGSSRALCWRLTMPQSTSFTGIEVVPIIVTAF